MEGDQTNPQHLLQYITSLEWDANIYYFHYTRYQEELTTNGTVSLLPPAEILAEATKLQEEFTEGSEMTSLLENYLDTLIPTADIWNSFNKEDRRNFIREHSIIYRGNNIIGTVRRNIVCSAEIAFELYGIENLNKDKMTLREINTIMSNLKDWHKESNQSIRMGPYGCQKNVYVRNEIVTPS